MNMIPELASLQNKANDGYRCRNATELRKQEEYTLPDCEFQFVKKGIDTYSIRSIANNEYFNAPIDKMTPTDESTAQHWKIVQVAPPNIYTIQNVANDHYMTAAAGSLHTVKPGDQPRDSEHWSIESLVPNASISSWMTENWKLIGDQPLDRVCLPGSHDSGTFNEEKETTFGSERNTRTQLFDIRLQLLQGVRVFDLRPAYYKGRFYTAHYSEVPVVGAQGAIGVSLAAAFDQIAAFVAEEENSRELIILTFSNFSTWDYSTGQKPSVHQDLSAENNRAFVDLVLQKLSPWLVCGAPGTLLTRTLEELMTGGDNRKNVIAVSGTFGPAEEQTSQGLWNKRYFTTQGGYSNVNTLPEMEQKQLINLRSFNHAQGPFMFELCWQLTLSDMANTPFGWGSIVGLANIANPALPTTVEKWMTAIEPKITTDYYPNVINTDACLESVTQAVLLSITINKLLKGEKVMAGWVSQEVTAKKIDDLYAQLQDELNKLEGSSAVNSAKATASDEKDSLARGVIFYSRDYATIPERPAGTIWTYDKWHRRDKYDELYREVTKKLNDLTPSQAYYSLVCFTNIKSDDETMALYWLK